MMKALSAYMKLAWMLKTPFIFLLDSRYKLLPFSMIKSFCLIIEADYEADVQDCDDAAWLFKAEASKRRLNGVGFVIGKSKWGGHAWNVVLTNSGIFQVEPQNGFTFIKDKKYRAWLVII